MRSIALLSHPDRVHRMERTNKLDAASLARSSDDGMPLNTMAHWQRLNAQSRLIVRTSTALEKLLMETEIDPSVPAQTIGSTVPIYVAFARYGRHPQLESLEGAYVDPTGRGANGQIQIAYIVNGRRDGRLTWSPAEIEAARIERVALAATMPVCEHHRGVYRISGKAEHKAFDIARTQILRILLALRFNDIERRKSVAEPAPWDSRLVTRYDVLEIGPNDLEYAVDDRTTVPGVSGIHRFERGRFSMKGNRLAWQKPRLAVVERKDLMPSNSPISGVWR